MGNKFSSGKNSIAECDRCGQRYMLKELKPEVIKTKITNIMVCPTCWDPDQPQLLLGMYSDVFLDPQAVRNPRRDLSLEYPTTRIASRTLEWGFAPVGLQGDMFKYMPNSLVGSGAVGTVIITTS
jgi:hypothetical protein